MHFKPKSEWCFFPLIKKKKKKHASPRFFFFFFLCKYPNDIPATLGITRTTPKEGWQTQTKANSGPG